MSGLESWEDDSAAQDDNLSHQTQNMNIQANGRGSALAPDANPFQPGAQSFDPEQRYRQYGGYQQGFGGQYYNQQHERGGEYAQHMQQGYGQYYQGYGQQQFHNSNFAPQQQQQPQQQQIPIIAKRPLASDPKSAVTASAPKPAPTSGPPPLKTLTIGAETPGATKPKTKVLPIGTSEPTPSAAGTISAEDAATKNAAKATENSGEPVTNASTNSTASGRSSPSAAESREVKRKADAVAQEQAAQVDEELLEEVYGKEHVNLIFIGHVDAGKSTLGGSILYATGMVDERTMEKYRRESKEAGESFSGSFISFAISVRVLIRYEKRADDIMIRSRNMGTFMGFRCALSSSPS